MGMPAGALDVSLKRDRDEDSSGDEGFESSELNSSKRLCKELGGLSDLLHDTHDVSFGGENFEEELISNVMKSLEKEINCHTACSFDVAEDRTCNDAAAGESIGPSVSHSASGVVVNEEDEFKSKSGIDIEYLLEATDDELGIPPSPDAQFQLLGSDIFDANPYGNNIVFDNVPSGTEDSEEFLQLCRLGNRCYDDSQEEQDIELFGQDWLTRSYNGEVFAD